MTSLSENIKNLGVRIKQIDKKIERRIKDVTLKGLKDQLTKDSMENPLFDFRKGLCNLLNMKMHEANCYMELPNEEWAIRIMINLLINFSISSDID